MTDVLAVTRRLADQGIAQATIEAAREAAARTADAIEGLGHDPLTAVDPASFQAEIGRFAASSRPPAPPAPAMVAATSSVTAGGSAVAPTSSIERLAALFAQGQISVREVTERHLDALERTGREVNALARTEAASALAQADAADARFAHARKTGEALPPLTGIPLAHKDLYARKGWRIEAGSAILKGHVAAATATTIDALDKAGAIDLGRLNTVEFALGPDGRNHHTGPVRNPWNPAHVTGGSSSGSGAAVAAGLVPAALGSDTGGSIRLPAAACGVVGLKPTAGLLGRTGIFPLSGSLDTAGPLASCVRDAAIVTQAMTGHDPGDPQSVALAAAPDLLAAIEDGVQGVRIGFCEDYFLDPCSEEVCEALRAAGTLIAREGAGLTRALIPGIEVMNPLNVAMINAEAAAQHRSWLMARAAEYGPETLGRLIVGLFLPAGAYLSAASLRAPLLRAVLDGPLREADILMTPVWPFDPPVIEGDSEEAYLARVQKTGHCTRPFNFLGLPAITVPCGLSRAGLPIAVQFVARPFEEALLLRTARAFERARRFAEDCRPQVAIGVIG